MKKFKNILIAIASIFMVTLFTMSMPSDASTSVKVVAVVSACIAIVVKFSYRTKRDKFIVTDTLIESAHSNGFDIDQYVNNIRGEMRSMNFDKSQERFLEEKINGMSRAYNEANPQMVGEVGANSTISGLIVSSIGDLNIKVKRNSANINQSLPFVLFGLNGLTSSFYSVIKQFLPDGLSFTVTPQANGSLVFTYTDSDDNVDTVTVSFTGLTNYLQFLNSMNQKSFTTKYILYTISDVAQQTQFDEILNFGLLTALGAQSANQLDLDSRIMSWQFKSDRVDVLMPEQTVGADFSFVQNIIPVANFSLKFNIFMSGVEDARKQR